MNIFQKLLDLVCFVLGPALLVANIFGFSFQSIAGDNSIAIAYFYDTESRVWIAIGVALLTVGLVRKIWDRKPSGD